MKHGTEQQDGASYIALVLISKIWGCRFIRSTYYKQPNSQQQRAFRYLNHNKLSSMSKDATPIIANKMLSKDAQMLRQWISTNACIVPFRGEITFLFCLFCFKGEKNVTLYDYVYNIIQVFFEVKTYHLGLFRRAPNTLGIFAFDNTG